MVEYRVLKTGDEPGLEAYLLPRIDSSMFLLGNLRAAGIVDSGEVYQGTYVAAIEREQLLGVVAHFWNQNLVLQAPPGLVVDLCQAAIANSRRPVRGLLGPADQVDVVKQALGVSVSDTQMDESEQLYSLDLQELAVPALLLQREVRGRQIRMQDVVQVAEWRVAYSLEALQAEDTLKLREQSRAAVERSAREGRTWILEKAAQLVACSSFNAVTAEAVQVGGVYTPPNFRNRGYARSVVAASLSDARSNGVKKALLFTAAGNIPAQKAYKALGFRHTGNYRILLLGTAIKG